MIEDPFWDKRFNYQRCKADLIPREIDMTYIQPFKSIKINKIASYRQMQIKNKGCFLLIEIASF